MADLKVNWEDLALELKGEALEAIKPYVEAAEADLREFGAAIARDMIRAVRERRQDLIEELGHQLEVLGEVNRIRLVNATWAQIGNILAVVGRVALKAIAAAAVA